MTKISPDEFVASFPAAFRRSAFRLELLDRYLAPNESEPLRLFLAGQTPDGAWREPWKRLVREMLARGKRMSRVHVVTEPLTDYLRFELTQVYPANVDAGEDVRILPRHAAEDLDLPDDDFWLLDDETAAFMIYDDPGTWLSVEMTTDPETVNRCCHGRDLALANALALGTYVARL